MREDEETDGAVSGPGRAPGAGPDADPWLRRFAARDPAAIAAASSLVAKIVGYRGFRYGRSEREDLVQETMAQVWEAIGSGRFDPGRSFESFVRAVATRRCIDRHRRQRAVTELPATLTSTAADPESSLLEKERALIGRRLIAGLGERCRELIRMHAGEGLTYGEIASRWGRSEGALRVQMSECLSRARRQLETIRGPRGAEPR